ncbi:MAG: site-specific recombinase [Baekduia sp.]|nr:site-specific recombinase [Baekduia sp.]
MTHDDWTVMSNTEPTPLGAVIYAAKSTADVHGSIPTQIADCRRLAEREGWAVIGTPYSDEAASAYKGNRGPHLAAAKERAEQLARDHGSSVLVVQHTDRLARGDGVVASHLVELALWARRAGVRIASVQDPATCEGGLAFAAMMGDRNHADSQRKALSVKDGLGRRRAKGMHNGGPRKFGYDYVRNDDGTTSKTKPLVIHAVEAAVVRRVYRDYAAGISQMNIQRALNAEGSRTTRGKSWHQGTIAKILADPFYAGLMPNGDGEPVIGKHEAIIAPELWERVRVLREQGRKNLGRTGGRPAKAKFLFTNGHLRCGRCGGAMVPRTATRKSPTGKVWGSEYEVYRCYTRIMNVNACDQRALPRAAVDAAALADLSERGIAIRRTREQLAETIHRSRVEASAQLDEAICQENNAAARLERVDRDYADGRLSADNFERMYQRFTDEYTAARGEREQAERHAGESDISNGQVGDAALDALGDIHEAIAQFVNDAQHLDELRLRLRQVFERYTVQDDGEVVGLVPTPRADALDAVMADIRALRREPVRATTHADALAKKSSAPHSNARTRSTSPQRPLRTSSGMSRSIREATPSAARTARTTSRPEPSGSPTSRIAKSGNFVPSRRRASEAVSATIRSQPSAVSSSARNVRVVASSSATRMVAGVSWFMTALGSGAQELAPVAAWKGRGWTPRTSGGRLAACRVGRTNCKIHPMTCEDEGIGHTMPTTSEAAVSLGAT